MNSLFPNRSFFASHLSDDESVRKMGHPKCVASASKPNFSHSERCASRKGEQGYLLLMVVVLAALILIALAIAAPKIKAQIQRDHEQELRSRGMAYAHAIKLYYKKFNSYPTNINQLVNSNNIKFLRKKYSDPVTGLKVWRPVYFGQVGWGGSTNPNCSTSASSFGGSSGGSSIFGSSGGSIGSSSSGGFGSSSSGTTCPTTADGSATTSGNTTGTTNSDGTQTGTPATPPLNAQGLPVGTDPKNIPDPAGFLTPVSSFDGGGGQTIGGGGFGATGSTGAFGTPGAAAGGGPIVGVASLSRKESIMVIKGKNHYNDLEFIYDPTTDFGGMAGLTGTGIGAPQTPPFGPQGGTQPPFGSPNPPASPPSNPPSTGVPTQ
jgi:type II secretory pathway pseudopilin PulG